MDELTKEQYRILYQKYQKIKNKLNNIEDLYEGLFSNVKEGLIIDDKVYLYDNLNNIRKNINNVKNETINEIIPNINNKI